MKYFFTSHKYLIVLLLIFGIADGQFISVDTSLSDIALVNKFIGTQNCITVSNVFINGSSNGGSNPSYGYFTKNGSLFEMDEGIILSTGIAKAAEGPNTYRQDNGSSSWSGDSDLADAFGASVGNYKNATSLEFDFVSTESNVVSFQYMFLSEEYDKYKSSSGCDYSDAFAFLIKPATTSDPYTNIALVPNTTDPVSVINVRGSGGNCPAKNENYFGAFNIESATSTSPTNFNGQTKVLTAIANVQVGIPYHIKLVIADEGTTGHDSAVFLKTGSFVGNIDIGNDLTIDNANPLCKNTLYKIQPNPVISDTSAQYSWLKDGQPLVDASGLPITTSYYDVLNEEGVFTVNVVLGTGCKLEGQVKIEKAPVAIIDNTPIMICDNDFDGKYIEKLSTFTNQIVTNFSRDFKVEYFTQAGTQINPDNDFEFTQNPQDITVNVGPINCAADTYTLRFYHGSQLQMDYPQQPATIPVFDVCDNELDGTQTTNLDDYIGLMTNEAPNPSDVKFYSKETDLINTQSQIDKSQTLTASQTEKTFYIRVSKPGNFCDNYSVFTLRFKQPKRSTTISDTIICKGTTIDLDAGDGYDAALGMGFSSYKWYKASDPSQAISSSRYASNLSPGDYVVELGFNGCLYKQPIKISEPQDLMINNVLIEGGKVTVLAANGIPPYQYSLDGYYYQSGNVYDNVPKGQHTITVLDACGTVADTFTIIGIKNVITPNDDGVNDVADYSDLLTKSDPRFEVYDRNGVLVFKGDTGNHYIWNGKLNGKALPSSSYWYILEWNETGNPKRVQNTGWILLKNRN